MKSKDRGTSNFCAHSSHLEVSNSKAGFQQLVKACGTDCLFIMEATGSYYLALAYYLHEQKGQVAVINPLVIKRFIHMHLGKGKRDRKDAQWLLRYGQQQVVKRWQPDETVLVECRQLEQVSEQLLKQKNMVANFLEALQQQPVICKLALKHLQQTWKQLDQHVREIETELLRLLEQRNLFDSLPFSVGNSLSAGPLQAVPQNRIARKVKACVGEKYSFIAQNDCYCGFFSSCRPIVALQ